MQCQWQTPDNHIGGLQSNQTPEVHNRKQNQSEAKDASTQRQYLFRCVFHISPLLKKSLWVDTRLRTQVSQKLTEQGRLHRAKQKQKQKVKENHVALQQESNDAEAQAQAAREQPPTEPQRVTGHEMAQGAITFML